MTERSETPIRCPACQSSFVTETLESWICADCGKTKPSSVPLKNGCLYQDEDGDYYTVTDYKNHGGSITFTLINSEDPDDVTADSFDLTDSEWATTVNQLGLKESELVMTINQ